MESDHDVDSMVNTLHTSSQNGKEIPADVDDKESINEEEIVGGGEDDAPVK